LEFLITDAPMPRAFRFHALPFLLASALLPGPPALAQASQAAADQDDLAVVVERARQEGVPDMPAYRKAREVLELKLLAALWKAREEGRFAPAPPPVEAELLAEYRSKPEAFLLAPTFTARQILILVKGNPAFPDLGLEPAAAEALAREARERLLTGDPWEAVAREFSQDSATRLHGGLIPEGHFGTYPREMEAALRLQEPGRLGEPVASALGWHVLLLERRTPEGARLPFSEARALLARRLQGERDAAAKESAMAPLRAQAGLRLRPAALEPFRPGSPTPTTVLATLGDQPLTEEDFGWFFRDAFRTPERKRILRNPGARPALVAAFLDLRALAVLARRSGLDREPSFTRLLESQEASLLAEFQRERDGMNLWQLPGTTEAEKAAAQKAYFDRIRREKR
jgi:hypothetical protein